MKIAHYTDYIDQVHAKFPDVDRDAICNVVKHGLGMMYWFAEKGQDIYLNHNHDNYYFYIGRVENDPYKLAVRSRKLHVRKLRMLYKLTKQVHDGYYYFGLEEDEYELHKQGLPIPTIYLKKIDEEVMTNKFKTHVFRVPREDDGKWSIKQDNYETKHSEYVRERHAEGLKSFDHATNDTNGLP